MLFRSEHHEGVFDKVAAQLDDGAFRSSTGQKKRAQVKAAANAAKSGGKGGKNGGKPPGKKDAVAKELYFFNRGQAKKTFGQKEKAHASKLLMAGTRCNDLQTLLLPACFLAPAASFFFKKIRFSTLSAELATGG